MKRALIVFVVAYSILAATVSIVRALLETELNVGGLLAVGVAAYLAGGAFVRETGSEPSSAESWRFSGWATLLSLVISAVPALLFLALSPSEDLGVLSSSPGVLAAAAALVVIVTLGAARMIFPWGADATSRR